MRIKDELDDENFMKLIVMNIIIARIKAGVSQVELSKMIGKKDNYIERLENLEFKRIPTETAIDIAIALHISVDSLLTFDDLIEKIIH